MRLHGPDYLLEADGPKLGFYWGNDAVFEAPAEHCAAVHIQPHQDPDSGRQFVFRFHVGGRNSPGMVVLRIDVGPDEAAAADEFMLGLRERFGIVAAAESDTDEESLTRVPGDSPEWTLAPASEQTEELYASVIERMAAGPGAGA